MKSRESSSFALSIHRFSSAFFREIVRVGNVRKERDRVCPSTLRTRPRIADNSGEKGSKERKLEELDSSRMQGISGILPRKQVSFCDDYSLSPYSNASLPPSILQRSPLFLPIDSQPRLWGDRSLHIVTAVISTDYILVRDLFLQRFHPIRGHVVSNLGTETARFSSRIEGKDFLPRVNENIFARTR